MTNPIERLVMRFRKHKFRRMQDANIQVDAEKGYTIPCYQCEKCGNTLHLDPWQMKELPASMKYYCVGA